VDVANYDTKNIYLLRKDNNLTIIKTRKLISSSKKVKKKEKKVKRMNLNEPKVGRSPEKADDQSRESIMIEEIEIHEIDINMMDTSYNGGINRSPSPSKFKRKLRSKSKKSKSRSPPARILRKPKKVKKSPSNIKSSHHQSKQNFSSYHRSDISISANSSNSSSPTKFTNDQRISKKTRDLSERDSGHLSFNTSNIRLTKKEIMDQTEIENEQRDLKLSQIQKKNKFKPKTRRVLRVKEISLHSDEVFTIANPSILRPNDQNRKSAIEDEVHASFSSYQSSPKKVRRKAHGPKKMRGRQSYDNHKSRRRREYLKEEDKFPGAESFDEYYQNRRKRSRRNSKDACCQLI